jgi:hypothetical protein
MVYSYDLPEDNRDASYASINNSLKRNQQLNRVAWLLVPPPPPPLLQRQQQRHTTSSTMLKISHMAITRFATTVPDNAGNEFDFQTVPSPTGSAGKTHHQTTSSCTVRGGSGCRCFTATTTTTTSIYIINDVDYVSAAAVCEERNCSRFDYCTKRRAGPRTVALLTVEN